MICKNNVKHEVLQFKLNKGDEKGGGKRRAKRG